jgi:hypothetical protein
LGVYWVLATGSRFYANFACILGVFGEIAAEHPDQEIALIHGMCDPRRPSPQARLRVVIPWHAAEKMSPEDQVRLLGGDWLADRAAMRLGWRIERRPADWKQHRKSAGFIRNDAMVAEMVANGATVGHGECVPFRGPCESPECDIAQPHESHGTVHCVNRARRAGISVREAPVPVTPG